MNAINIHVASMDKNKKWRNIYRKVDESIIYIAIDGLGEEKEWSSLSLTDGEKEKSVLLGIDGWGEGK